MSAASPGRPDVIRRITEVEVSNFRGFVGEHELDLDADLVLITGPNGQGKTSLLQALLLVLTGWHEPRLDPVRHLLSQKLDPDGAGKEPEPCDSCKLHAVSAEGDLSLGWTKDHTGVLNRPEGLPASRFSSEGTSLEQRELVSCLS